MPIPRTGNTWIGTKESLQRYNNPDRIQHSNHHLRDNQRIHSTPSCSHGQSHQLGDLNKTNILLEHLFLLSKNNVILTNVSSTDIQVVVTNFSSGALIVHAIGIGPGIALVADWEVNWNVTVQKIIIGASLKSRASSPR